MSAKLFFCYAHEDEVYLYKFKIHLTQLQQQGIIGAWHERDITAGTEWEHKVDQDLNSAHIILLLVSPDFMNSDYCYSIEMMKALERHKRGEARVIPVILSPVYWQRSPFARFQVLPTGAIPVVSSGWHTWDEAFFDVTEGIRKAVEQLKIPVSSGFHIPTQAEMRDQEKLYHTAILNRLYKLYMLSQDNISPGIVAKTDPLPKEWVERELEKMGETWRQDAYYVDPVLSNLSRQVNQIPQSETRTSDEAIKQLIAQLSEGFLSTHMKGQLTSFRSLWERLKVLPLQTLGQRLEQSTATQGLGFAGKQQVLPIVSTMSWAILNWSTLRQGKTPEQITEAIVTQANARGCSRAVGYAIARYLQQHVPNS
jgi:hypothetical protein